MSVKVFVIFYSTYGHIYRMAEAVAQGVRAVEGAEASLFQVPELMDEKTLKESGAFEAKKAFAHVPVIEPDQMAEADALIFGTPTRFGNMAAQMRNFWDRTGGLWVKGSLVGKPTGVFASTATQHGGQETTLTSFHTTLLHHGMIIVGVPFIDKIMAIDKVSGGTPYGATTIAGADGSRLPTEDELYVARFQGLRITEIAQKLKG